MDHVPEYAESQRPYRQFTASQQVLMGEVQESAFTSDKVTCFGLRPPELLFVAYLKLYLSWFSFHPVSMREDNAQNVITSYAGVDEVENGYWFDGISRVVKVRVNAVPMLYQYVQECLCGKHGPFHPEFPTYVRRVIHPLCLNPASFPHLVDSVNKDALVVVSPLTLPASGARWLVHLLLFYGRYSTELDLFTSTSLLHSYSKAGLYRAHEANKSCTLLLNEWGITELKCLPGSYKSFCRNLCTGKCVLERFFCINPGEILYVESPLVILRQLQQQHSVMLKRRILDNRHRFINALQDLDIPNIPPFEVLFTAEFNHAVQWSPHVTPIVGQTAASVTEQNAILAVGIEKVNAFVSGSRVFIPFLLLAGGPGNGKTTLMMLLGAFARSQGLEVQVITLSSERSLYLGGCHVHKTFGVKVNKTQTYISSSQAAYYAISNIQRDALNLAYLLSVDVFLLDECGLVDECLFTTISEILCTLRGTRCPFGGCQLFLSGDCHQLSQIHGNSLWSSVYTHSLFDVYILHQSVRCGGDPILQKCITILRKEYADISAEDNEYLSDSLINNCVLRTSIEEVRRESGHTVFEVYSKRVSERLAVKSFAEFLKSREEAGDTVYTSYSVDEINDSGVSCSWKRATDKLSKNLDNHCLEAHKLTLACGVILRFTRNGMVDSIRYSQGQLCMCSRLPTNDDDGLELLLMPPGFRRPQTIDLSSPPNDWAKIKVFREYGYDIMVRNLLMRRKQFPVVNHVSSTLHRAIGLTLDRLTSRIMCPGVSAAGNNYCLWEKQQLLVLISRCHRLSDITLINTPQEITDTVSYLLSKRSPNEAYIGHIMRAVGKSASDSLPDRVIVKSVDMRPRRVSECYVNEGGCIYALISATTLSHCYIGETVNLVQRVDTHNRGIADYSTSTTAANYLRPWFVGGVIVDIPFRIGSPEYSHGIRRRIEDSWQRIVQSSDVPAVVLSKGKSLIIAFSTEYPSLKFIDFFSNTPYDM